MVMDNIKVTISGIPQDEHEAHKRWLESHGMTQSGRYRRMMREDLGSQALTVPPTKVVSKPTPKDPVAKVKEQLKAVTSKREIDEGAFCMKHDAPERKIAGKCPKCRQTGRQKGRK